MKVNALFFSLDRNSLRLCQPSEPGMDGPSLKFFHQNVGSIYSASRKTSLRLLLDASKSYGADFIGVTETWLNGKDCLQILKESRMNML